MSHDVPQKVAIDSVAPNHRRGGDIRVLLSPRTVGSTSGFLGTLTLPAGQVVTAHIHPHSEEFMYVVRGTVVATVDGRDLEVGAGEAFMVPTGTDHRLRNDGDTEAFAVFHLSPLAPRPDLGHVDTEHLHAPDAAAPSVGPAR